jgi:hypothetical protein
VKAPKTGEMVIGGKGGIAGSWQECDWAAWSRPFNDGQPTLITQDEAGQRRYWLRIQTVIGEADNS